MTVKATIPLSYTVNVSISGTPSGLGEFNTNTICVLTNEQPLSINPYIYCVNAQDAINEYGTGSKTAQIVQALFTPVPNLRTGNGQVLIFPYVGTDATQGKGTTEEITSQRITNFKAVSNGKLTVSIDNVDYTLTGLNFSQVSKVSDIAEILNNKGLDCDITVDEDEKIVFTARTFGTTSIIDLKATSEGGGIDIYGENYLGTLEQVNGTNETGNLTNALAQAEEVGYFGGVLTTQYLSNPAIEAFSRTVQAKDHIYYEAIPSLKNIAILGNTIKSAGLNKTRLLAYTCKGKLESKIALATYTTIAQSSNYSGSNTALTMNLKELTGVTPDTNMNSTYYNLAKANGVDIYGTTEGLSCVYSFSNGYYTDEATNILALKKGLEVSGFNYLRKTNTKIPQTETGMTGLKNAYASRCEQYVKNGVIGAGNKWNDSIPFGDPEEFQRNIEEKGYYIYSLPISEQQQAERVERVAPVVQIAIKLAGAIHSSNVIVQIQK